MDNEFINKVRNLWNRFCSLGIAFVLTVFLVRIFETVLLHQYNVENGNVVAFNLTGFFFDVVLYLKISPILFLVFALIGWLNEKLSVLIIKVLHVVLLVTSVSLIIYFCSAHMPLDKVFIYYSKEELLHIIGASETTYIWAYFCLALIPIAYLILSKIKKINRVMAVACVIPLIASYFVHTPTADGYPNRNEFFIKKNKIEYFFDSFEKNLTVSGFDDILKEEAVLYELYPDFDFVDPQYPFLYKDNACDVLSPFLKLGDKKPNIVVFIVEGLARENSGNNSTFISSTPFLDSLSQHALCWDNCFSTSPRTCGVLPSLLGSLPYGKSGFMSYGKNIPEFNSLPKILRNNGYRFAFFYGGWLGFDDVETFLYNNNVDVVLDPMMHKTHERRNTWGVFDDALIDEAMKTIDATNKPHLDVFLTLSTHDPWDYPNSESYQEKYASMATPEKIMNTNTSNGARGAASYLYVDDCMRKLIKEYSKHNGFENTIFVFTGDHNFSETDYLHQYRVPFVIWSPMLKRTATFKPIVTHRDFTPTILALLKNNYNLKTPSEVTWLSQGFDTVREYRAKTIAPHITYSRNISGMFYDNYLIQDKNVYKLIYENNDVVRVKDESVDSLIKYLNAYKILDRYIFENDALVRNDFDVADMNLLTSVKQDSIIECGRDEYPLTVMEVPLEKAYKYMKIDVSFDIFMHRDEEKPYSSVYVQIMRKKKNGEMVNMSSEHIDLYRVWAYDVWRNWSIDEVIKQKNYNYEKGDKLVVRFWNYDKLPFKVSNIKVSLSVSK